MKMREPRGRSLPEGSIDTHFHVFGPQDRYPYAAGRSYTPPDARYEDWRQGAGAINVRSGVLVSASVHGFDNRQILDMLRQEPASLRAVVALRPDVSDTTLAELHALGVRGARINTVFASTAGLDSAQAIAAKLRGSDWHIEFLSDVSRIDDLPAFVRGLRLPTVFGHFGHVPARSAMSSPGFLNLCGLVRDGEAWVKLSGSARLTDHFTPPFDDLRPMAEALIAANPARLLWGSDWPHTAIARPSPGFTDLASMVLDWLGSDAATRQVLVENPKSLYSF